MPSWDCQALCHALCVMRCAHVFQPGPSILCQRSCACSPVPPSVSLDLRHINDGTAGCQKIYGKDSRANPPPISAPISTYRSSSIMALHYNSTYEYCNSQLRPAARCGIPRSSHSPQLICMARRKLCARVAQARCSLHMAIVTGSQTTTARGRVVRRQSTSGAEDEELPSWTRCAVLQQHAGEKARCLRVARRHAR